jgi:hypothetical protein
MSGNVMGWVQVAGAVASIFLQVFQSLHGIPVSPVGAVTAATLATGGLAHAIRKG